VTSPHAMGPFGSALRAHVDGDTAAELLIRREDGLEVPIPIGHFFREAAAFSRIEHDGESGPFYGWLQADPKTLAEHAEQAGWGCEVVLEEDSGEFLARLWPRGDG